MYHHGPLPGRHAGLEDAAFDLLEELFLEVGRARTTAGVRVLGLEVGAVWGWAGSCSHVLVNDCAVTHARDGRAAIGVAISRT
jgi:hypothetical protein